MDQDTKCMSDKSVHSLLGLYLILSRYSSLKAYNTQPHPLVPVLELVDEAGSSLVGGNVILTCIYYKPIYANLATPKAIS